MGNKSSKMRHCVYVDEYGHEWHPFSFSTDTITGSGERKDFGIVAYGRDAEEARDMLRKASFNEGKMIL